MGSGGQTPERILAKVRDHSEVWWRRKSKRWKRRGEETESPLPPGGLGKARPDPIVSLRASSGHHNGGRWGPIAHVQVSGWMDQNQGRAAKPDSRNIRVQMLRGVQFSRLSAFLSQVIRVEEGEAVVAVESHARLRSKRERGSGKDSDGATDARKVCV